MARGSSAKTAAKIDVCMVAIEMYRTINVTLCLRRSNKDTTGGKRMNEELPELKKRMRNESELEREKPGANKQSGLASYSWTLMKKRDLYILIYGRGSHPSIWI
jgi:hypothetical protein